MIPHSRRLPELAGLDATLVRGRCEAGLGREVLRAVEAEDVAGGAAVVVGAVEAGAAAAVLGTVVETVGTVVELAVVVLPLIGNWLSSC
jgi:hypothetical protein